MVKLYETPDELRPDRTISYSLDGKEIHKQTVKQGRKVKDVFVFESDDRNSYCDTWVLPSKSNLAADTVVNEDLAVSGASKETLAFYEIYTTSDTPVALKTVNHVFRDGTVVVPQTYAGKTVTKISMSVFYNLKDLKTVYIPSTMTEISTSNFQSCPSLTTINFAGTKAQWDSMNIWQRALIPSSIQINYEVTY